MSRVRLLGPRDSLGRTLDALQDFGRVQLDCVPVEEGLQPAHREPAAVREERYLRRLLDDVDSAMSLLAIRDGDAPPIDATRSTLARWARFARRTRRHAERLNARKERLQDERTLLKKYEEFLSAFRLLLAQLAESATLHVYGVTLPKAERARVDTLAAELRKALGIEVLVSAMALSSGDLAVLIAVPSSARPQMERALSGARIPELPLPAGYTGQALTEAAPHMLERLDEIPRDLAAVDDERHELATRCQDDLRRIRKAVHDRLASFDATRMSAVTAHAFALEGWVPSRDVTELKNAVAHRLDQSVLVQELAHEEWHSRPAPVVLQNPRLFRPFEVLTSLMPLPRYGSMDPTPFVAVGFPMLFGLIMGDVGYGGALAALALMLRRGAAHASMRRKVSDIALPCALFAVIFGVLYGELFGTLGRQWFGIRPLSPMLDREKAVLPAVVVAVGIGVVHMLLSLVLGIVTTARGEPRVALSRTVQFLMLVLVVLALLAAVEVLPSKLFTPFGIAVLVGLPVLLVLEGIVAPIEFLSTLGHVLSYVRIMALGTASVLLASVANEMSGMFGSVVLGALFALLFHLVNFALGLISPTIHALRLHYVEFFRQFYSPGGQPYEPFTHWRPHGNRALLEKAQ